VKTQAGQNDFVAQLRAQLESHGDSRSLTFLGESRHQLVEDANSFRDLDRAAREVAGWLSARPESNRPVLLLFEPSVDFWRAFLGCLYAGVAAVPVPLPMDDRSMKRVAGILRDTDGNLALTTTKLRALLVAGVKGAGLANDIQFVATDEGPLADADAWTQKPIGPDTVAVLQYTSGSTGDPKGVVVTHGNLTSNITAIIEATETSDESVVVTWVPHFHDMGLISVLVGLYSGANIVGMSPIAFLKQPIRLLQAFSDYRGTITGAPNFAYDLIARRVTPEQLAGLDLSSWKVAINGAEPVRRRTIERITEMLAPTGFAPSVIRPGYGLAEATLMATFSGGIHRYLEADADAFALDRYLPATGRAVSLVSSGAPAPGFEVRIVDPDTFDVLADDLVGEIWLRGDSIAHGYHNRPEQTAEDFHAHTADGAGPYLRTGDLGMLHEGELYVIGRSKDLLIVNGRNLYPQDLEEFVQELHPAVAGSRGVAISVDVKDVERIVLIQAIKSPLLGDTSHEELAAAVKGALARNFGIPAPSVVFVNRAGIHLTTSGKVQRSSMRAAFLSAALTDVVYANVDPALT
jgi:acyl-CoA synthetase (AMP-forming)/AMP-acid ligase II